MKRSISVLLAGLLLLTQNVVAEETHEQYALQHYDEHNGLAQRWATQIIQGDDGYIWVSTWNGLDRFDGYEFVNFKSTDKGGYGLPTDRISDMWKLKSGDLLCLVDYKLFVFNTRNYQFTNILEQLEKKNHTQYLIKYAYPQKDGTIWVICQDGQRISMAERDLSGTSRLRRQTDFPEPPFAPARFVSLPGYEMKYASYSMTDKAGNDWYRSNYGIYKAHKYTRQYKPFPVQKENEARCFLRDDKGRLWVSCKENKCLMLFDAREQLVGFVTPNGKLTKSPSSFGAAVYCMFQDKDGILWLGTKPDGLFRLQENGGSFAVCNYKYEQNGNSINENAIYDVKSDAYGRMWIASFSRGVLCFDSRSGRFHSFRNYPFDTFSLARDLIITKDNVLLAATTGGLVVADISGRDLSKVKFHTHVHDYNRSSSLNNNATMSLFQSSGGTIYVATESGGINRVSGSNLLSDQLEFTHLDLQNGFPSDVVLSLFEYRNAIWAVCNNMLVKITLDGEYEQFDVGFFKKVFRYSDAKPLPLGGGKWLLGLLTGAMVLDLDHLHRSEYVPPVVITGYAVNGGNTIHVGRDCDTLRLMPSERNVSIHFAALDFTASERLEYAFNVNDGIWNHLQKNHAATFLNMEPGTYRLCIRSTNHDGVWVNNDKVFTIVVEPTIWETSAAKMLYVCLFLLLLWAGFRIYQYVRSIKTKNKHLEAYLAIINARSENRGQTDVAEKEEQEMQILETAQILASDDAFMKRVVSFVEAHLGDADVNIGDMADAAATSRSGLNRKMKAILGITPKDFLCEVRIQKACQLLKDKTLSVNDVAYMCGFSDSRYFSRAFKAKMGVTPSEYRVSVS